jgi:hypothetical protein
MYLISSDFKRCLFPVLLGAACLVAGTALAGGQRGEKIEFSEPSTKSAVVTSNLNRINTSSNLKPVPENFFNRFNSLNSLEQTTPIPFRQPKAPPLSKHARELLEQRKNWAFTDLKDLSPEQSLEASFGVKEYGPDGREKKTLSSVDKYYESLGEKQNPLQKSSFNSLEAARGSFSTNGMSREELSREGSPSLRNAFILESGNPFVQPGGNVATFANSPFVQAAPPDKAQIQHRLEFQKLLANAYSPSAPNPANPNLQPGLPGLNNNGTFSPASQVDPRSKLSPYLGVATAPVFRSQVLRDPTARALGLPDPSLLPKPDVAPKAPPPSAFATPLPMRKF